MRDTRKDMLVREAIYLGQFAQHASASHFSGTPDTPGLTSIRHQALRLDRRAHFTPRPCEEAVVPPMVACVSYASPDKVEHHVAGMCPYRTYTWEGKHGR